MALLLGPLGVSPWVRQRAVQSQCAWCCACQSSSAIGIAVPIIIPVGTWAAVCLAHWHLAALCHAHCCHAAHCLAHQQLMPACDIAH